MKNSVYLAGCIIKDNEERILLLHRTAPGRKQWEIPGGKLEPGEAAKHAAARELHEELGIAVKIGQRLGSHTFTDSGVHYYYTWYAANVLAGKPRVLEPEKFDDVQYFHPDTIHSEPELFSVNVHNFLAALTQ